MVDITARDIDCSISFDKAGYWIALNTSSASIDITHCTAAICHVTVALSYKVQTDFTAADGNIRVAFHLCQFATAIDACLHLAGRHTDGGITCNETCIDLRISNTSIYLLAGQFVIAAVAAAKDTSEGVLRYVVFRNLCSHRTSGKGYRGVILHLTELSTAIDATLDGTATDVHYRLLGMSKFIPEWVYISVNRSQSSHTAAKDIATLRMVDLLDGSLLAFFVNSGGARAVGNLLLECQVFKFGLLQGSAHQVGGVIPVFVVITNNTTADVDRYYTMCITIIIILHGTVSCIDTHRT